MFFSCVSLARSLYCPCSFSFRSWSTICLLQLGLLAVFAACVGVGVWHDVLSAGEEAALLGHLVAVLSVCADHPDHADDAAEDQAHDGRVALPVVGLGVPTSGRRPDVLGVTAGVSGVESEPLGVGLTGSFLRRPL